MCKAFGISRSGYYASKDCGSNKRKSKDAELMPMIKRTFEVTRRTYGARSIGDVLRRMGIAVGRRRVRRLMDAQGLHPQTAKAFRHGITTRGKSGIKTPDLVNRNFSASAPNRVWTGDITEIPTAEGKLYVAIIEDLFSRYMVGWAMMMCKRVELVKLALSMACVRRHPVPPGCIFHSDKGSQYDCIDFRTELKKRHFQQSMGSTGDCFDNATSESAISTIKSECLFGIDTSKLPVDNVRSRIFDYIEAFYNKVRRHTANGGLSPEEFERQWNGG
jgi:putative transposase